MSGAGDTVAAQHPALAQSKSPRGPISFRCTLRWHSQCERGQPLAAPQCLDTSVHTTGMSFKNVALSRKWRLGRAVVS